ncbi:MAG: ribosome biogenesis GTPase Der [Pelagibacterales bacterium]|nr:ribosome biogenesis GTPase Der [Pelagibacterales bacterium]OUU62240.1 MAG: ribosome biogenesis GTPase Der [Alphaproteobacteria bacterium TMED62]
MNSIITNIVIVGRSNVGKSTLYNRLLGKKEAITGEEYGLTRDYQSQICTLNDIEFNLIDTAGYNLKQNELSKKINDNIKDQINKADIIFFVVDISTSLTSEDIACWDLIRRRKKNIILIANKAELKTAKDYGYQINEFGIEEYTKITALSKTSISLIYDLIKDKTSKKSDQKISLEKENTIRLTIVGQPNVGKSTLYNLLYGENRVITAPISGTTRDSIMSNMFYKDYKFELIDTAGLRKKNKININIEFASAYYSRKEIRYANCVVLVIDSLKGMSSQDIALSNYIIQEGRSILLIFNKWDLIVNKNDLQKKTISKIDDIFFDAKGINILFMSSKEKENKVKVCKAIIELYKKWNKKISTSELNKWFSSIWEMSGNQKMPGSLKFKYISQNKIRPPTFSIYHNKNSKVPKVTKRYIVNRIREKYGFEGIPIRINLRTSKNPFNKKK